MGAKIIRRHRLFHNHHPDHQATLSFATLTALAFLLLASVSALGLNPSTSSTRQLRGGGGGAVREERRSGGGEVKRAAGGNMGEISKRGLSQRLSGPGSSPPLCRSKCGNCTPCKPVHVPIQPGFSMPLEYYPEAWRCKCGNKLFMP